MRSIDVHAHLMPQSLWRTVASGRDWYGTRFEPGDGLGATVTNGKRSRIGTPKVRFTPEERLADMDAQGVDVQVVSIHMPLVSYHLDPAQGRQLARDVNDEIAAMTRQWPQRFAGLATLPAQDVGAAIDELERAVHVLGLKGAELDTVVNGDNWDEPRFLPLFKAAESMGAVLFFHPQPLHNFMLQRTAALRPRQQHRRHRGGHADRGDPHLRRHPRRLPRPQGVHRARGRARVLRHGAARPRLAGPHGGAPAHPEAAEHLPAPPLLRLRGRAASRRCAS